MQELEKILEEINQEKLKHWDSSERLDTDKLIGWCFDKCTEIIRKHMADAPENDGWIPVEERLPKTNGTYNVTRHIDGHFISDSAYFDGQNTWHSDNRVNHSRPYLTDVIAWRPLSGPYRPERSNDEKK